MEHRFQYKFQDKQQGITLVGLIFVFMVVGFFAILGLKVVPTYTEYMSVKKAIVTAKNSGSSVPEIRASFDKNAVTGYIESVTGKDLEIIKAGNEYEVSFAYQKKIPLVGPASLLLEYEGTTATAKKPPPPAF